MNKNDHEVAKFHSKKRFFFKKKKIHTSTETEHTTEEAHNPHQDLENKKKSSPYVAPIGLERIRLRSQFHKLHRHSLRRRPPPIAHLTSSQARIPIPLFPPSVRTPAGQPPPPSSPSLSNLLLYEALMMPPSPWLLLLSVINGGWIEGVSGRAQSIVSCYDECYHPAFASFISLRFFLFPPPPSLPVIIITCCYGCLFRC